jgi:hypothetical protein
MTGLHEDKAELAGKTDHKYLDFGVSLAQAAANGESRV